MVMYIFQYFLDLLFFTQYQIIYSHVYMILVLYRGRMPMKFFKLKKKIISKLICQTNLFLFFFVIDNDSLFSFLKKWKLFSIDSATAYYTCSKFSICIILLLHMSSISFTTCLTLLCLQCLCTKF